MSSGTDKIVSSIMSEAQEKADVIIQEANAEVSAITAKAEKAAEAEKIKIQDNGKKQSDMRYQQIISEAKMNARRAELGAKEEVIEAAFTKATEELKAKAASGDDEYKDSLSMMIKEATDEIGSKDLIIQ
ncbi:MAG: V-type ATP synthase subunit E, partial [Methanobrevibacter sp.]|nr:V-type ATP synthase subunit E [Methanobrevibacter sp.]